MVRVLFVMCGQASIISVDLKYSYKTTTSSDHNLHFFKAGLYGRADQCGTKDRARIRNPSWFLVHGGKHDATQVPARHRGLQTRVARFTRSHRTQMGCSVLLRRLVTLTICSLVAHFAIYYSIPLWSEWAGTTESAEGASFSVARPHLYTNRRAHTRTYIHTNTHTQT